MGDSEKLITSGAGEFFEVGKEYRDARRKDDPEDQFLSWVNLPNSGLTNAGGIRALKSPCPARKNQIDGVFLFTHSGSTNTPKPWEDIVDHHNGVIYYWGDSISDPTKSLDDFKGNKILRMLDENLRNGSSKPAFILHFTKRTGYNRFNGLCILEKLDTEWFMDGDKPVRNYRATLRILNSPKVAINWLTNWRLREGIEDRLEEAPSVWRDYVNKNAQNFLTAWNDSILTKADQLPTMKSPEWKALQRLNEINPYVFEQIIVDLLLDVGGTLFKNLEKTKDSGDGGFDFIGSMMIDEPFRFEIKLKGEVKRYASSNYINPVQLSRLAARLDRGEYGVYVTTSFFSKQAQEEVHELRYPLKLIHGKQLMNIIKRSKYWIDEAIDETWLNSYPSRKGN